MEILQVDAFRETGDPTRRFFLGDKVSIVDCMFAPFLERMAASIPYYKVIILERNIDG
jgi:glutathione S-transferase